MHPRFMQIEMDRCSLGMNGRLGIWRRGYRWPFSLGSFLDLAGLGEARGGELWPEAAILPAIAESPRCGADRRFMQFWQLCARKSINRSCDLALRCTGGAGDRVAADGVGRGGGRGG